MAHFLADTMTSGGAPVWHAGLNTVITTYNLTETGSGSLTIGLTPLPAGAQITDVTVFQTSTIGTGGEVVDVYATIGGTEVANPISSATNAVIIRADDGNGMGVRLTGSANLTMRLSNLVNTGVGSVTFRVVTSYLRVLRGD